MNSTARAPVIDTVGELVWLGGLPVSLGLALWIVLKFGQCTGWSKVLAVASIFFGFLTFFCITSLGIVARDGLGPDAVSSFGVKSIQRAAPDILFGLVIGLTVSIPGLVLVRKGRKADVE